MGKRIKALLLAVMVFVVFAVPTFATTNTDKYVGVDKTVTPTAVAGLYDVQLKIVGTLPVSKPVDVVLVIDSSYSMDYEYNDQVTNTRRMPINDAKTAANDFIKSLLSDSSNRVAVVDYHWEAKAATFNGNSYFTNSSVSAIAAVNDIETGSATNIQAGFQKATKAINGSNDYGYAISGARDASVATRAIILLSDGVANYYYNGFKYVLCAEWPGDSGSPATVAATEAGIAAQQGGAVQVFTVGLFGGIKNDSEGKESLGIARTTLDSSDNAGYFQTDSSANLSAIYTSISKVIDYAASKPVVTDIVPEKFEIVQRTPSTFVASEGDAKAVGNIVTWDDFTVRKGTYTLNYQIRLKDEFGDGSTVYVNDDDHKAILKYTDVAGNTNAELRFPDRTVSVLYTYSLGLENDGHGTAVVKSSTKDTINGEYSRGTVVTVSQSAISGYHFLNWTEGLNVIGTSSTLDVTMNSDRTIKANFEKDAEPVKIYYTLTATAIGGGAVTGTANGTYESGKIVSLSAEAITGYHFVKWVESGKDNVTTNPLSFELLSDRTITAVFEKDAEKPVYFELTATAEGEGTITGTENGSHLLLGLRLN